MKLLVVGVDAKMTGLIVMIVTVAATEIPIEAADATGLASESAREIARAIGNTRSEAGTLVYSLKK
jgi:hypothetical protein